MTSIFKLFSETSPEISNFLENDADSEQGRVTLLLSGETNTVFEKQLLVKSIFRDGWVSELNVKEIHDY